MLEPHPRQRLLARSLTSATLGVSCCLVVFVIVRRIASPVESEWMTGSILDHIERVMLGQPVYVAPSSDWIPFLYPPGYYWAAAWLAKFVSLTAAARGVSLAASCIAVTCTYFVARSLACSRFWAWVAAALFVSCYTRVAHWFDIERCDPLFLALLALATWILIRGKAAWHSAVVGLLFALACMTKQQGILVVAASVLAQLVLRRWRHAFALSLAFVTLFAALFVREQMHTDGWFRYYCWSMPSKHGIEAKLITLFLVVDHAKFIVFSLASVFSLWCAAVLLRRVSTRVPLTDPEQRELLFLAVLLSCWCSSGLSRMHLGGFPNVLLPWLLFGSIAVARSAATVERLVRRTPGLVWSLHGALSFGVMAGFEDPFEAIPTRLAETAAADFRTRVRTLEERGEVLVTGRGHVTQPRHFHMAALVDVLREGDPVASLRRDLERKRFAAIIIDAPEELYGAGVLPRSDIDRSILRETVTNYCVYRRLKVGPNAVSGLKTQPLWLLLPRKSPLPPLGEEALLSELEFEVAIATATGQALDANGDDLNGSCESPLVVNRGLSTIVHEAR